MEQIFISHDSVEAGVADALRTALNELGHDAFVARTDIRRGVRWESAIAEALRRSTACLVLCSRRSLHSQWVWMEFGAATVAAPERVIPVILPGLGPDAVPEQFQSIQHVVLDGPEGCQELAEAFGGSFADGGRALFDQITTALDWRRVRPGRALPSAPSPGFLVDLSHQQDRWPGPRVEPSVFSGFGLLPNNARLGSVLSSVDGLALVGISDSRQLFRGHLSDWTGLVVVSPWRASLTEETIDEIDAWVRHGGRLLLQGYEYGDRHHGGNLNDLAARFGVRFRTDIVAPSTTAISDGRLAKPYDVAVPYPVSPTNHPLTSKVESIALTNSQSVEVEPGGEILVSTGANLIAEPDPARVRYESGRFVGSSDLCLLRGAHPWLGVVTVAPRGLTGDGEVIAMGSWLMSGDDPTLPTDTRTFTRNVMRWLSGS